MKVTELTRNTLRQRRWVRAMKASGYEEIGERGGRLWELHRGYRIGCRIVDAQVSPDGLSVWVLVADERERRRAA